jgi:hypothetical protein
MHGRLLRLDAVECTITAMTFGEGVHNGTKSLETKYSSQQEMLKPVLSLL